MLRGRVDPDLSPDAKPPPIVDEVPVRELADVTRGLPLSDATAEQVQALADSDRPAFAMGQAIRTLLSGEGAAKGLVLEATRRAGRWAQQKRAAEKKPARPVTGAVAALDLRKSPGGQLQTHDELTDTAPVVGPPPANNRKVHPFVGTIRFHGLPLIRLENMKGSTRSGTDADGKPWSVTMPAHYGEFARTEGADGDPVDVFVGANRHAAKAYVIHLQDPTTGDHDEDKVFLGLDSADDARACFAAAYNRNDLKMGPVRAMTTSELAEWLAERENRGQKIEAGRLLAKSFHLPTAMRNLKDRRGEAPICGCGTQMRGCRCKVTATHDGWLCPGCGAHGGIEAAKRTPADLRSAVEKSDAPASQTYGTTANMPTPKAAEPPPAPPPVAKPLHHQDAMQLPTKPTKRFPPPSHPKPTRAPRKLMETPPELTKAQRHDADALLKAAGVEPAAKPKKPRADANVAKAKIHERMQKLHTKAADEAANRGDGALSKLHADAAEAHGAAMHAHGAGLDGADALSDKAKAATQATLPKPAEGKGNAKQTSSAQAEAQEKVAAGEVTDKPNAGAAAAGVGGRSKEGLKVIAIGPKGGKIVGYTTKDGKQKPIYEGSKAASKLAATVATHAPDPKPGEPAPEDGAAAAGDAADPPAADKGPAGKGGDYHRAKQAEHDKAAKAAEASGDAAGAEKHKDAARAHWAASLQNDKSAQGDDAAGASEWADEKSAKATADDSQAASPAPAPAPAPAAPSEPIDDKPLSSDAPPGGTPTDAPAPEDLGSASPKTDSPESRHAEELAKMRGQVEEAHRKLEALAHHIDTSLVPMFNNLKAQARATHKNPSKSAVGWLLAQVGRFAAFVLGLHEDKGKVSSAADAIGVPPSEKPAPKPSKPSKRPRMKSGKQASAYMQKSLTASSAEGTCVEVLVTLQAIERLHHAAHLQAKGPESYSDHLLFGRLYEGVQHEIDGLSEKMVAAFGGACVDADARGADAAELLADWSKADDTLQRALDAEMQLQDAIADALAGDVTAGLENFLQGIADSHETAIYLLQQRIKPAGLLRSQRKQADDLLKAARSLG